MRRNNRVFWDGGVNIHLYIGVLLKENDIHIKLKFYKLEFLEELVV